MRILFLLAALVHFISAAGQSTAFESSEWKRLQSQIAERSVVGFGETGHGYESINAAKSMVFDFLRERLNFETIVFESSFTECMISYLRNDPFDKRLKSFLYPFWNTASVRASLRPVYESEQQKQERLPAITACDIQEDCRFTGFSAYLINEGYVSISKKKLAACDSVLSLYIGKKPARKGAVSRHEYAFLLNGYNEIAREFDRRDMQDDTRKILLRCIENRKWLCYYLTIANINRRMSYRDSLMAENVIWLKRELLGDKKIVLWSADTHISKPGSSKTKPNWMGERLALYFKNDYYTISFQKGISKNKSAGLDIKVTNSSISGHKFDAVFNLRTLKKIDPKDWITPCDQSLHSL